MRETSVSSRVLEYLDRYLDEPNSCRELRVTAAELHALLVVDGVLGSGDVNAVSALLSSMARRQFIRTDGRAVAGSGRPATVYVLGKVALDYKARRGSSPGGTGGHARTAAITSVPRGGSTSPRPTYRRPRRAPPRPPPAPPRRRLSRPYRRRPPTRCLRPCARWLRGRRPWTARSTRRSPPLWMMSSGACPSSGSPRCPTPSSWLRCSADSLGTVSVRGLLASCAWAVACLAALVLRVVWQHRSVP